jgi:hypothetical protein
VDALAASLQELQKELQNDIANIKKDVLTSQMDLVELCTKLSGQQASLSLPSLHVHQAPMLEESATTFPDGTPSAPLPSSAVSTVSTSLSSFLPNALMLKSPHTQMISLLVPGPSGLWLEQPHVQSTSL